MTDYGIKAAKALLAMQRLPWEQGYAAQAFYEAGIDDIWLPMARESAFRSHKDGRLALVADSHGICDPASSGEVCLRAWEKTGDTFYLNAANGMRDYLLNTQYKSADGCIFHMTHLPQIWIDAAYMMPPFLKAIGEEKEAEKQINGFFTHLKDAKTGLFGHIHDFEDETRSDRRLWATGNGWILMALARMDMPYADEMIDRLLKYENKDGLLHDMLDDENTFLDGTSSLMTAYAILRRAREGRLPENYVSYALRTYETCKAQIDEIGLLHGVCGAPHFDSVGTSAEAQASFILVEAELEKLG